MTSIQSVQGEHERFLPHLEEIKETADSIGKGSSKSVLGRTGQIHEFLAHRLIPYAVAEGRLMLPLVRRVPGAPSAPRG